MDRPRLIRSDPFLQSRLACGAVLLEADALGAFDLAAEVLHEIVQAGEA